MSELLPYEEQLAGRLANIPLPDEDKGWDAMRKMLEDDDDGVVPPPPNTGCRNRGLLGMLLLLLLAGLTVGVYKMVTNKQGSKGTENSVPANKPLAPSATDTGTAGYTNPKSGTIAPPVTADSQKATAGNGGNAITTPLAPANPAKVTSKPLSSFHVKKAGLSTTAVADASGSKKGVFAVKTKRGTLSKNRNGKEKEAKGSLQPDTIDTLVGAMLNVKLVLHKKEDTKSIGGDTSKKLNLSTSGNPIKTRNDSIRFVNPKISNVEKTDSLKPAVEISNNKMVDGMITNNQIYFSGGLGLQQLIPIEGQKANPYNAFGRKSSLADYIPSVYFRVHQNRKFLQVEFKYGAPQYTKDIAYSTKVLSFDSATRITSSSVNHVNKTYYHQLPISLHYNILPSLSIGAGVVWNKFQSAVVTQENHAVNGITGTDSVLGTKVINVKSDSAFSKTYWQCMLEAQYTWRRFSFGARYAWGLSPYLSYTSPTTGQTQKERNASLNVFLRYELWRSKRK